MEKDMFSGTVDRAPGARMDTVPNGGSCGCVPDEPKRECCTGYEGCGEESWGLCDHPLAMVYAPCQMFRALYDPDTALSRGTLFTELDLPLGSDSGFSLGGACCRAKRV